MESGPSRVGNGALYALRMRLLGKLSPGTVLEGRGGRSGGNGVGRNGSSLPPFWKNLLIWVELCKCPTPFPTLSVNCREPENGRKSGAFLEPKRELWPEGAGSFPLSRLIRRQVRGFQPPSAAF